MALVTIWISSLRSIRSAGADQPCVALTLILPFDIAIYAALPKAHVQRPSGNLRSFLPRPHRRDDSVAAPSSPEGRERTSIASGPVDERRYAPLRSVVR